MIAQHVMEIISDCESEKISRETLDFSEIQDLYSLIGIIASVVKIPEQARVEILKWALERQAQALQSCPADYVER